MIEERFRLSPTRDFTDYEEDADAFVSLPYSDLTWDFPPDIEAYRYIHYFFPIERLGGVRQLGFLSFTGTSPERYLLAPYPHQREDHSWATSMVCNAIGENNGLGKRSMNLLRIGSLIHDIGMTAGGDAVKAIDPDVLDEESNWQTVISRKGFRHLARMGVALEELDDMIKNKGLAGSILEFADRVAYVTKDAYNLLGPHQSRINSDYYLLNLRLILSRNPMIGNIYKDVITTPQEDGIFFSNPDNLFNFLLLRAYLHKDMYMHPANQGRDMLVRELVTPFYSRTDGSKLTPKKLRRMEDRELLRFLAEKYSVLGSLPLYHDIFYQILINQHPKGERFESRKDAETRRQKLEQNGMTILGVEEQKGFDTGVDYKVVTKNGIVPFSEAYPVQSRQIEKVAEQTKGVFVYYVDPDDMTNGEDIQELIEYARRLTA